MAAYLYGAIEVTDAAGYEEYRNLVPAMIAAYGGRYLARGGTCTALEGEMSAGRHIILEFPDMERLLAFYHSPEYQPLKALRQRCSTGSITVVEGV